LMVSESSALLLLSIQRLHSDAILTSMLPRSNMIEGFKTEVTLHMRLKVHERERGRGEAKCSCFRHDRQGYASYRTAHRPFDDAAARSPATFPMKWHACNRLDQSNLSILASDLWSSLPSTQIPHVHFTFSSYTTRRVSSSCLRIISTHQSIVSKSTRTNCYSSSHLRRRSCFAQYNVIPVHSRLLDIVTHND
jgi:hypothetical protein